MSRPVDSSDQTVSDAQLRASLEDALANHFRKNVRLLALDRRPSEYRSSFAIEELRAQLDDGSTLEIVFKNLSRDVLDAKARRAKPEFLYDPAREIETYRMILSPNHLSAPLFYGAVADEPLQRYWLFIERARGVELYQSGDFNVWMRAARWLADMHSRFAHKQDLKSLAHAARLLIYDERFYRVWIERAQLFLSNNDSSFDREVRDKVEWLASRYDKVVERLVAMPVTFIHGEFYASNVLVEETGERVCPVDWEMSAVAPGLVDVAALAAGSWSEQQKAALASAYLDALSTKGATSLAMDEMLIDFQYCRLHIAVQWLGWFGRRRAFEAHAHDWSGESINLAEQLGL